MKNRELSSNIGAVMERISRAAERAGRRPKDVKLVAVTKGADAAVIRQAIDVGLREFGESRIQAAKMKICGKDLRDPGCAVTWHLIGHLQSNKAKTAVELFDLIQSLDSPDLARVIDGHAGKTGKVQRVLVQVKLAEEETKYGTTEEGLAKLLAEISSLKNIRVEGLMAIPPFFDEPELARPYFRRLRELRDAVAPGLKELSMGMSGDFEVAIEEGATIVRVGTAIFGERRQEAL